MTLKKTIESAAKAKKLVIGTRQVFKGIKRGAVKSVICASNCPKNSLKDLDRCAKASKIEVDKAKEDSAQLGELCAKPFNILLIGIKK